MHKELDFVVAGVICLDVTPRFLSTPTKHIEDILIPSKTIFMGNADIHCGGCVSNTGLALSYFGHKVALMGRIGSDSLGQIIQQQYSKYPYYDALTHTQTAQTSYSIALAPPGIDRIFLYYPGCNDDFSAEDLDYTTIAKAKIFHLGYPQALKKMYEKKGENFLTILKEAEKSGVLTSVDTCGIDANSQAGKADWTAILKATLPYIDFFLPSLEELCYMADYPKYLRLTEHFNGKDFTDLLSLDDIEQLACRVMKMGARILMVKCGHKGIYFRSSHKESLKKMEDNSDICLDAWAEQRLFIPAFKPKYVLSATGAGDVAIAAFLSSFLRGFSPKICLRLAAMAGCKCCEAYDALGGLPSFDTLLELLPQEEKSRICD